MNVRIDKVMDISAYACYISLLYFRDVNIYPKKGFHIYSCKIDILSKLQNTLDIN